MTPTLKFRFLARLNQAETCIVEPNRAGKFLEVFSGLNRSIWGDQAEGLAANSAHSRCRAILLDHRGCALFPTIHGSQSLAKRDLRGGRRGAPKRRGDFLPRFSRWRFAAPALTQKESHSLAVRLSPHRAPRIEVGVKKSLRRKRLNPSLLGIKPAILCGFLQDQPLKCGLAMQPKAGLQGEIMRSPGAEFAKDLFSAKPQVFGGTNVPLTSDEIQQAINAALVTSSMFRGHLSTRTMFLENINT